jgi:hypothetical protein
VNRLGSVISGIPGHLIEDVKISNVQILQEGGGTKEDAAYQPPEYEDMYPEPGMFTGGPRPNGRGADGQWHPEGYGRGPGAPGGAGRGPGAPGRAGVAGGRGGQGRGGTPPVQHKMPSYGFYVRHVKGIQFDNIDIRLDKEDMRPAFVLDDVQDVEFFRIKVPKAAGVPVFSLHKVEDFSVSKCSGVPDTQLKTADNKTV